MPGDDDVVVKETTAPESRTPNRSRRPLAIVALLAVLAVGVMAIAYLAFFNDDAPDPLALSDQPATSVAGAGSAAAAGLLVTAASPVAVNAMTVTQRTALPRRAPVPEGVEPNM